MCGHRLKFWKTKPSSLRSRLICWLSAATRSPFLLLQAQLFAGDQDLALVRVLQQVDAAQEGGFARAGRSEDGDHVAVAGGEGDALEHFEVAVALVQVTDFQCGVASAMDFPLVIRIGRAFLAKLAQRFNRSQAGGVPLERVGGILSHRCSALSRRNKTVGFRRKLLANPDLKQSLEVARPVPGHAGPPMEPPAAAPRAAPPAPWRRPAAAVG